MSDRVSGHPRADHMELLGEATPREIQAGEVKKYCTLYSEKTLYGEKVLYRKGKGMLTAWGFVEQAVLYCCRFLSKNVIKLYGLRGLLTSALKIKLLWRRKKKVLTSKIVLFCYPSPF